MKVTFVYSNGKTFTASNVAVESLAVDVNEHGDKIVSYTRDNAPLIAPHILAEAIEASDPALVGGRPRGMSIDSEFSRDNILERASKLITGSLSYQINARITGLEFLVIKSTEDDDEAFNNLDAYGTKNFTIVPVNASLSMPNVVDAVRLL